MTFFSAFTCVSTVRSFPGDVPDPRLGIVIAGRLRYMLTERNIRRCAKVFYGLTVYLKRFLHCTCVDLVRRRRLFLLCGSSRHETNVRQVYDIANDNTPRRTGEEFEDVMTAGYVSDAARYICRSTPNA